MENFDNTSIPVWVCTLIFMREHHDIGPSTRIDSILLASQVISSIIDAQNAVLKDFVVGEKDGITIFITETELQSIFELIFYEVYVHNKGGCSFDVEDLSFELVCIQFLTRNSY